MKERKRSGGTDEAVARSARTRLMYAQGKAICSAGPGQWWQGREAARMVG